MKRMLFVCAVLFFLMSVPLFAQEFNDPCWNYGQDSPACQEYLAFCAQNPNACIACQENPGSCSFQLSGFEWGIGSTLSYVPQAQEPSMEQAAAMALEASGYDAFIAVQMLIASIAGPYVSQYYAGCVQTFPDQPWVCAPVAIFY